MNDFGQTVAEVATLDATRTPGTGFERNSMSLPDFARDHAAAGLRVYPGSAGAWWLQYEIGALMRFPIFAVNQPLPRELMRLYAMRLAPLLAYLVEPTPALPANSLIYVCTNQQYRLKELDHSVQGNVKRGLRECQIRSLTLDEVIRCGERAFIDTSRRHGWAKVSPADFQRYLSSPLTFCGNRYFGAWKDGELAAFAGLIDVEDWVEVRVRYSTDASLSARPNDALLFHILSHYLAERKFRIVSAGASSIDPTANTPGLHRFKVKLGFQSVPVRRVFCAHPLLRVFVRPASLVLSKAAAKWGRGNYRLGLAEHVLKHVLHRSQVLPLNGETRPDEDDLPSGSKTNV